MTLILAKPNSPIRKNPRKFRDLDSSLENLFTKFVVLILVALL